MTPDDEVAAALASARACLEGCTCETCSDPSKHADALHYFEAQQTNRLYTSTPYAPTALLWDAHIFADVNARYRSETVE